MDAAGHTTVVVAAARRVRRWGARHLYRLPYARYYTTTIYVTTYYTAYGHATTGHATAGHATSGHAAAHVAAAGAECDSRRGALTIRREAMLELRYK